MRDGWRRRSPEALSTVKGGGVGTQTLILPITMVSEVYRVLIWCQGCAEGLMFIVS